MDRFEFCNLMEQAKLSSGVTSTEISFAMKMLFSTFRRFEKGKHNFSMTKALEYINALHAELVIYNDVTSTSITEYSLLIEWLISARKKNYTQQQLADNISISRDMLIRIESQRSNISVDIFLKIIDVLGYKIDIQLI